MQRKARKSGRRLVFTRRVFFTNSMCTPVPRTPVSYEGPFLFPQAPLCQMGLKEAAQQTTGKRFCHHQESEKHARGKAVHNSIIYKEMTSSTDQFVLNNTQILVSEWCAKWQLTLNVKKKQKSALLRVTCKQNISKCFHSIDDTQPTSLKQHKYLVLVNSKDLPWLTT